MDRLVFGMANINFQQNCSDNRVHNSQHSPNSSAPFSIFNTFAQQCAYSSAVSIPVGKRESMTNMLGSCMSATTTYQGDELKLMPGSGEIDEDDIPCSSKSHKIGRFSQQRKMPSRSCKENLDKVKRRSITKPKRSVSKTSDAIALRPEEIKKIYLNKSLAKFRPSNLETIFEEEPQQTRHQMVTIAPADDDQLCFIGTRKIRRSLSCSDGFNINKSLIRQRRARVKKTFGRRFALKKIALEDFVDHLNKSVEHGGIFPEASHTLIEELGATAMTATATDEAIPTQFLDFSYKTVSMPSLNE